jgi:hypothetical protein
MKKPLHHVRANSIVERVRTNSVLNPLLWLCGIIVPTTPPAIYFTQGDYKLYFFMVFALTVTATLSAYFIWMFKDPNRLQSEDYQLAQQRILQGTKDEDEFPTITQTSDHESKAISSSESDQPDDPPSSLGSLPSYAAKCEGT